MRVIVAEGWFHCEKSEVSDESEITDLSSSASGFTIVEERRARSRSIYVANQHSIGRPFVGCVPDLARF